MGAAFWWGMLAASALLVGQLLAGPLSASHRTTGLVMGFGAGALLSAVAYELVPEARLSNAIRVGAAMFLGALAYYLGDRLLDRRGAGPRHEIRPSESAAGSGAALFVGALLDGVPETFILGMDLATGGSISVAFLAAVLVSNVPQGVAGTTGLKMAGYGDRRIFALWAGLALASGGASALGYAVAGDTMLDVKSFAAGAILMMLADSMIPEAYANGGRTVGFLTVCGFLTAAALSVAQ